MKLLDDLYYVLSHQESCMKCMFLDMCEEGFSDKEGEDEYTFCGVLEIAKRFAK